MTEIQALFARQAEWQKRQKALSWAEKIRMAERVREAILRLRASATDHGVGADAGRLTGSHTAQAQQSSDGRRE